MTLSAYSARRLSSSVTGVHGGTGVGLTIVKRLTDRFGWAVDLHSELGVGTTATIRFPNPQPV